MAALMASSSAFAGAKVQARVTVKSTRAKTVIMANSSGPKRVSATLFFSRDRLKNAATGKVSALRAVGHGVLCSRGGIL